jgi:hypothetical protein
MKKLVIMAKSSGLILFFMGFIMIGHANAEPVNLCLNPAAIAADTTSALYAIDGDSTTAWHIRDYATPSRHYILTVDIGKVYPVNRIVLKSGDSPKWSDQYYINYMLLISVDNVNWQTIVPFDQLIDSPDGYFDVVDIATTLLRYV